MTNTAWVFPGQGAQIVGMGTDLADLPSAKAKLEIAKKVLGWSVLDVCQGEESILSQTVYTQPCLYAIESILSDLLLEKISLPHLLAGHSLGEYVALYTAGVFDFESGLNLVKKRAELMDNAAGGKMAALMKFDREKLNKVIEDIDDVVLANDNSDGQVVISGTPEGVDLLLSQVKAKRVVELNVSGAFHSPLMGKASEEFKLVLDTVSFNHAKVPVLSNVDPVATTDSSVLKQRLIDQMTGSVRWRETMEKFNKESIKQVIEVGPGKVLSGLIKRACRGVKISRCGTLADLKQFEVREQIDPVNMSLSFN